VSVTWLIYMQLLHILYKENAFYTYGTHSMLINGIGLCECNIADLYAAITHSI